MSNNGAQSRFGHELFSIRDSAFIAPGKFGVGQIRQRDAFRRDRDHTVGVTAQGGTMTYVMKPLACDPKRIKGMSEQLIVSHYENNYGGAVNRLNAIAAQLAELDFAKTPGFVINGLKREELIASNSMILHELFFASLADETAPEGELRDALPGISGASIAGGLNFPPWARRRAAAQAGCCLHGRRATASSSISGRWTTPRRSLAPPRFWRSICTSTPITWITGQERRPMSMRSWRRSTGQTSRVLTANCVRDPPHPAEYQAY